MKSILLIIMIVLSFNLISAGLIVNSSTTSLNKVYGQNTSISFTLTNTESYSFYNVSLESNNLLYMPTIPELQSGQSALINSVVYGDNSSTVNLRIKGFYTSNLGIQNKTWDVNVDYYSGLSVCDFSIVRGDKVRWNNLVADDVVLRNANTGNDVTTVYRNTSYTSNFDTPDSFKYTFLRRGLSFTNVCTITSLSDSGLINNPAQDGRLNFTMNLIYNPTSMNISITQTNYTIPVFTLQDGVLTVSNTGNATARGVTFSSDWMTFSANGFDLSPGQIKGIIYTIRPVVSQTSQTNQTYDKILKISGNFADINQHLFINIPFAYVNNSNITSNYAGLIGMLQAYCKDNPTESFCITSPQVVYMGNSTDNLFNVTMSQEQMKKLFEYMFQQGDNQEVINNYVKDSMASINEQTNGIDNRTQQALNKMLAMEEENRNNASSSTFLICFVLFIITASLLVALIYIRKRYDSKKLMRTW